MARTCEGCGETFETLSEYRLHDCPARTAEAQQRDLEADREEIDRENRARRRRAERYVSEAVTTAMERTREGETEALYQLLAHYERELASETDNRDRYWDLADGLAEQVSTAVDTVLEREGWAVLGDVVEAYHPEQEWQYPHVSHVLTNAVGRFVIRTRRADGIEAVPEAALDYLACFDTYPEDDAWSESLTYGWGIGHPEHPFADRLRMSLDDGEGVWVSFTFEHVFYADQHAAVDLFEEFLLDVGVEDQWLFASVLAVTDRSQPHAPRYWDWDDDPVTFDWDPEVERRLRETIDRAGMTDELPSDWSFADLAE